MIKFSKEHIHKQWSWDILLSEKEKIITRCEKIEYFSKKLVNSLLNITRLASSFVKAST